ncbi:DUF1129 family protein [Macrococcoides caseolyticum]|uniref:DUF1129 family protein n=1 Tax=Macrococcoides caseolyticum TaxID=69966 RepID=UPI001F429D6B|nr:DUF1129 family protein [Macrococcus caseolyticus]MCE4955929.1 DUF1129 family protein [Macrococcus caseolyticus]
MAKLNEMDVDYQRKLNQLTPSNKTEFLKVRNALKFDFKVQEREADNILSDILDHLIDAQNSGISTKEFFGTDTHQFTQDLFEELPKNKRTHPLWYVLFTLSLSFASILIPFGLASQIKFWITGSYVSVNIHSALVALLMFVFLITSAIFITIQSMKNNTYNTNKGKLMTIPFYIAMTFVPLIIYFIGYNQNLSKPSGCMMLLIGIPFLFITILTYKKKISY